MPHDHRMRCWPVATITGAATDIAIITATRYCSYDHAATGLLWLQRYGYSDSSMATTTGMSTSGGAVLNIIVYGV